MNSYIDERLKNWGVWLRVREDNGLGYGNSPLANMMRVAQSTQYGASIPIDETGAEVIDKAVRDLPRHLQVFARLWYMDQLPKAVIAKRLACSRNTVSLRIEEVKSMVLSWVQKRDFLLKSMGRQKALLP